MILKILNKDIYKFELKRNFKNALIWFAALTAMSVMFMLLFIMFAKMDFDLEKLMEQMGFGIINSIGMNYSAGYFALEVATFLQLGGALYAAFLSIKLLAGEEKNHTAEFLLANPIDRRKIWSSKLFAMVTYITVFVIGLALVNFLLVFALNGAGSASNTAGDYAGFWLFFGLTYLMMLSLAFVCYFFSVFFTKSGTGLAIALAFGTYILPIFYGLGASAIKNSLLKNTFRIFQFLSPYSFSDANLTIGYLGQRPIIDQKEFWITMIGVLVWIVLSTIALIFSFKKYYKKDIL